MLDTHKSSMLLGVLFQLNNLQTPRKTHCVCMSAEKSSFQGSFRVVQGHYQGSDFCVRSFLGQLNAHQYQNSTRVVLAQSQDSTRAVRGQYIAMY